MAAAEWDRRFDATRIEQFLALQRELLLASGDPDTLPDRLAQGVAIFLGVAGSAVGMVQEDRYRLLATYGLSPEYRARYDGVPFRDSELAPALASARPLVLADLDREAAVTTVILPFGVVPESPGGLHLVAPEGALPPAAELGFARAVAGLAGIALANARQCQRLSRLAQLKGDALAAMAHDLRAPLNALVGYTGLLAEGGFGALTREQREVAEALEHQATELVDLLGATLDVARLETGRLPIRTEEFGLGDVLAVLQAGTFVRATHAGQLRCRLPTDLPRLHTDRVKVKQIVQNVIDNALKHSVGAVEVEASVAPDRGAVRIMVRDAGPGIAADVLPHLFEPFRVGAGPGRGTGFGLYIVRCFAEALGGRVAAHSAAGEGTTVTVELPLAPPAC